MTVRRPMPLVLFAAALALSAVQARAADVAQDPARNEVSVYGGLSILDARSTSQATFTLPAIPGLPNWPSGADVRVTTGTKLGNSFLLGGRYAFYLRKQLALEADFSVAPSHELRGSVGLCGASGCAGRGDWQHAGSLRGFDTTMNGVFSGPMAGGFRGMRGMRGGEGRFDGGRGFGGRDVTAWHYGAGLTYDLLGKDVRPFLVLGAGGVSYDGTSSAKTDFVLRFGAGVKVYFGRLGARVDAVDYLVFNNFLSGKDEHDIHLTGGAFVRF